MVMADGIALQKEIETLYRIGKDNYKLSLEDMNNYLREGSYQAFVPENEEEKLVILYNLALVAWADGSVCDEEMQLLEKYAKRFGVSEEYTERLINLILEVAEEDQGFEKVVNQLKTKES